MGFNTRQNSIGLAGKPVSGAGVQPGENDQRSAGTVADPVLKQYVIELPAQTAAGPHLTGFVMPANAISAVGYIKSPAPLVGTAPTISVGVSADPDALFAAANVVAGLNPTLQGADISGGEIEYTMGGTVTTGQDMELVLTILASDT